MQSWMEKPTIEEKLEAYQESEDFKAHIVSLKNDYDWKGLPVPSEDELKEEILADITEWLKEMEQCKSGEHDLHVLWYDLINGTSELKCVRGDYSKQSSYYMQEM